MGSIWSLAGSGATPSGADGFMGFGFWWCRIAPPPPTGCRPSGMEGGMWDALEVGRVPDVGLRQVRARGRIRAGRRTGLNR